MLERIVAARGRSPKLVRLDNGAELAANAARLVPPERQRGRVHRARLTWENLFVESVGSRVRDEVLALEV